MPENSPVISKTETQQNTNYGTIENTSNSTVPDSENLDEMKSSLNFLEKIGYGLGHVYNDLSAGVWFSYTLLFLQGALKMNATVAGVLVMLGQVGDAIATPIAGYVSDHYGTKRKWHVFGSFLVFFSFPAIFSMCPFCDTVPWWQPLYFTISILFFQLGWAIVQITHLSMIPELSKTQKDRSNLTATRYSASVVSNLIVYVVAWAVLHGRNTSMSKIGPADAYRFRDISLILTLVGISMTVLFQFSLSIIGYDVRREYSLAHHLVPDPDHPVKSTRQSEADPLLPSTSASEDVPEINIRPRIARKNFFNSAALYQNALLYVFSRLFMTTSLIYMPLWLNERSNTPTPQTPVNWNNYSATNNLIPDKSIEHIATVPLVSFLSSFVSSVLLKYLHNYCGHQFHYLLGSTICISACIWVNFQTTSGTSSLPLYGIAILFGAGSSITMISSLCITADMIGLHSNQGGFIYSAVTFADKLITGIVVVIIETVKCKTQSDCPEYYRDVLAYGCGLASILGIAILLTLQCNRQRTTENRQEIIN